MFEFVPHVTKLVEVPGWDKDLAWGLAFLVAVGFALGLCKSVKAPPVVYGIAFSTIAVLMLTLFKLPTLITWIVGGTAAVVGLATFLGGRSHAKG